LEKALKDGISPQKLTNEILIPSIREVGNLYDKKIYFLPQLIMSAETVKKAFDKLENLIEKNGEDLKEHKKRIILATVQGDVHDIGKNIVALMLKNHGYEVIDLGKDVNPNTIVSEAKKRRVHAIGLSALMTTTMPAIQKTVEACRAAKLSELKYIVGGAVLDQDFANSIGVNYAKDAVEAIRVLDKIFNKNDEDHK
jgi:5-methyltetrahydrofolate--homocysteine methyltransferase